MSDQSERVDCSVHGPGYATFVCEHVRRGVACGFVHDTDDSAGDPCPDAWCSACNEVLAREGGEWTEAAKATANICVLCPGCYEEARARNERLPEGLDAKVGELDDAAFTKLVNVATHATRALQDAAQARTRFLDYARWDIDPDAGTFTFTDPARPSLRARYSSVGSFSTKTNTWMWSWNHDGMSERLLGETPRLRAFGESRGAQRVAEGYWNADEVDGWEMTSLAAHLLGADAVYRAPIEHVMFFVLLHDLRLA